MLRALSVQNIVLIDRLDIDFREGLSVLTGETGAGKSILLDSLALVLGRRADASLLRAGAEQGVVTAEFDVPAAHPVYGVMSEQSIVCDGDSLLLRRTLGADGRSRAYLNDQPVSAGLLRSVGDLLVEIHGQHGQYGLLNSATHRDLLDAFGGLTDMAARTAGAYRLQAESRQAYDSALEAAEQAEAEADYLAHVVEELQVLGPQSGEEDALADRRALMMNSEKIAAELSETEQIISRDGGADGELRTALRRVERAAAQAGDMLEPLRGALERAVDEVDQASAHMADARAALDFDPGTLDEIEERLFALRAAARKHRCGVDDLPRILGNLEAQLEAAGAAQTRLHELKAALEATEQAYVEAAEGLSKLRKTAARKIDAAVKAELPPLKLEKAVFQTRLTRLPREQWSAGGCDQVLFEVATNAGAPFGPLAKIASGGELSRFSLALKVVLAQDATASTIVFDEIDNGVGGAVATAVGDRLLGLGQRAQVLVVTHSPQVAARGTQHILVGKSEQDGATRTQVHMLDDKSRREEIARMLAGARVTDEARAAAERLMVGEKVA